MTEPAQGRTGPGRSPVVLRSLRGYRRSWLTTDLLAAVTLLAIAVPEQLATSRLAGMPPVTGFYAFVAGTVLFALLGSNPRMSVGADSTIAPLFAVGVAHFAASGTGRYQDLVGILAVMVGALVALVWLARLGWISELLSAPIITGFLAGIAVIIIVHQLPDLFGVHSGGGSTLHRIGSVISHLGHLSVATLVIGLAVFALVIAAERIDGRLPGALAGLVGATIVVAAAHLDHHGVEVLGPFAHGAPRLGLGGVSWATIQKLAPLAAVVALVVVSQSAATTRAFAAEEPYPSDVGRDFLAVGAGNVAAGLFGAFPVNASPARTAAVAAARGRTQLACLLAAVGVAAVVPAAGLLRDVPLAALAGVLLFVATRIFGLGELRAIAHFDRFELGLAVVTLLAVALIGVEQGIGVAVGLAILDRTRLTARPQLHVLGRIPGTTSWAPVTGPERPAEIPGVLVVLFAAPLWYANATHFRAGLDHARRQSAKAPRLVVLDALGMYDVDFTGSRALSQALDALTHDGITFAVARAGDHLKDNLARGGLLERIGTDHFYASVDEAVTTVAAAPSAGAA
ncbi:MAG TPA: SulP family inorganic anion transporter [Solirubrobacteraceae bacterium]|jgi:high affinity sulfate transporter 1|nr:SulP family inorganic anion transporter [Solirubrobacteraceae bacterium]